METLMDFYCEKPGGLPGEVVLFWVELTGAWRQSCPVKLY